MSKKKPPQRQDRMPIAEHGELCHAEQRRLKGSARLHPDGQAPGRRMPPVAQTEASFRRNV